MGCEQVGEPWRTLAGSRRRSFPDKYAEANQFSDKALNWAERQSKETAAQLILKEAMRDAMFGNCGRVSELTSKPCLSREQANLQRSRMRWRRAARRSGAGPG